MGKGALLFGLLMLGVGIGVGAVVFGSGPGELEPTTSDDLPPREEVGHVEEGPMLTGNGNEVRDVLARAIAVVEPIATSNAEGAIEVFVTTDENEPVEGVDVILLPPYPRLEGDRSDWSDKPLEETLAWTIAQRKYMRDNRKEARTDADGRAQIGGLIEGEYRIRLKHPAYSFRLVRNKGRSRYRCKAGDTMTWIASKVTGLRVEAVMPDGSEARNVLVNLVSPVAIRQIRPDRTTGITPIEPGVYEMHVTAGKEREWESSGQQIEIRPGEVLGPVRVQLEERLSIEVRLNFGPQEPRAVRIAHTRVPAGLEADPDLLASRLERMQHEFRPRVDDVDTVTVITDDALEPGRYLVAAFEADRRLTYDVVTLSKGKSVLSLQIPEATVTPHLMVTVHGPGGAPPMTPQCQIRIESEESNWSSSAHVKPTNSGGFRLLLPAGMPTATAEAKMVIVATVGGWGTQALIREASDRSPAHLVFKEPATVSVEVSGVHGSLFEGTTRVHLRQQPEGARNAIGSTTVTLDSQGRGEVAGVQPGTYRLRLGVEDSHWHRAVHEERIELKPGKSALRFAMPALMVVTVRTAPGVRVRITPTWKQPNTEGITKLLHWYNHQVASSEGIVKFTGVPAGWYSVHALRKSKEIEVRRDMEVSLLE